MNCSSAYGDCDMTGQYGDCTIVKENGDGVSRDYVDSKGGKMSLFRHVTANKIENNWVWNGIYKENLSDIQLG